MLKNIQFEFESNRKSFGYSMNETKAIPRYSQCAGNVISNKALTIKCIRQVKIIFN